MSKKIFAKKTIFLMTFSLLRRCCLVIFFVTFVCGGAWAQGSRPLNAKGSQVIVQVSQEDLPLEARTQGVILSPQSGTSAWALIEFVKMISKDKALFKILFPPEVIGAPLPQGAVVQFQVDEDAPAAPPSSPAPPVPSLPPPVAKKVPVPPPPAPTPKPASTGVLVKPWRWAWEAVLTVPFLRGGFPGRPAGVALPQSASGWGLSVSLLTKEPFGGPPKAVRLERALGMTLVSSHPLWAMTLGADFAQGVVRVGANKGALQSNVTSIYADFMYGRQWDFYRLKWAPEAFMGFSFLGGLEYLPFLSQSFVNSSVISSDENDETSVKYRGRTVMAWGLVGQASVHWFLGPRFDLVVASGLSGNLFAGAKPLTQHSFTRFLPSVGFRYSVQ